MLGVDASYTDISSTYYNFMQGGADDYLGANASRGEFDAKADGNRLAAAAFLRTAVQLSDALRITLGGRFDWLRDSFEPDSGATRTTDHGVPSARAGINFRYAGTDRQRGHVYASVGTSFKAPTPDQLYDQRKVPVPFDPFLITFSNFDLEPQRGTNLEAGVYHSAALVANKLDADLSLSIYQLDLEDELDFDVQSLSYGNIGESRHRGLEAGLALRGPSVLSGFANYTLQAATARSGENTGNYLKAIPRQFIVSGLTVGRNTGASGSLVVTHAQDMPLDDANTRKLPDWTRWDARFAYTFRDFRITADLLNLADAKYSTTGFPDPSSPESDVVYYYPAAGRTLHIGLSWR
jgi:outer membrane cobalamin receptor